MSRGARSVPGSPLSMVGKAGPGVRSLVRAPGTTAAAVGNPLYLNVPMIAPAFPALRPVTASFRALLSAIALGWAIGIAFQLPVAIKAVNP